ncbi:MAG: hypothetical protein IKB29_00810, partial [Clostridia bacterium]|nr:hypothetical protein [Clostridia bacterium]
ENVYFLLGRRNLITAGEKALKKAEKYSATGVSFGTLGELAYSDYKKATYINRYKWKKMQLQLSILLKRMAIPQRLQAAIFMQLLHRI